MGWLLAILVLIGFVILVIMEQQDFMEIVQSRCVSVWEAIFPFEIKFSSWSELSPERKKMCLTASTHYLCRMDIGYGHLLCHWYSQ